MPKLFLKTLTMVQFISLTAVIYIPWSKNVSHFRRKIYFLIFPTKLKHETLSKSNCLLHLFCSTSKLKLIKDKAGVTYFFFKEYWFQ